jgi:hypothetical protein
VSDSKLEVLRVRVEWGERRAPELPYVVEVSPSQLAPRESLIGMDIDSAWRVLADHGWQMKRFEIHGPKQEYTLERERT